MRTTSSKRKDADEPRPEYDFDYSLAKPNRFAGQTHVTVVQLDDDVAAVFKDEKSVNEALRTLIKLSTARM